MTQSLILKFPDQSQSFTNGFEVGAYWERMSRGELKVEGNIHSENEEVIRGACFTLNYIPTFQEYEGYPEWKWFLAIKITSNEN